MSSRATDSATDEHGFRVLLAVLVLLTSLQLLAPGGKWDSVAVTVVGVAALAAALWWLTRNPLLFWIGAVLLVPALGGGWLFSDAGASGVGGSPYHAPFFFYVAIVALAQVLRAQRVTEDTILGAACAYLLASLAFASVYEAAEFFSPGSIAGLEPDDSGSLFSQLSYFSLVTLTTLGYGDLSPVHPLSQSLAILESVIGVLFPALVVARIIGVHAAAGASPLTRPEVEQTRESIVSRFLFVFLPVAVLTLPWVERASWGRGVVGVLLFSILIAGVYFVSGRRRVIVAGLGATVAAASLRIIGGDVVGIAIAIEVALIVAIVGGMSLWFFRQRRSTTSAILAAVSIYWLIGVGFGAAFELIERIVPGAVGRAPGGSLGTMLYFSFMTLTTTGYGDLTPAVALTRMLASVEAFVGIFYPAIVIAKLVSLYDSDA